jgi:hypothetical protein
MSDWRYCKSCGEKNGIDGVCRSLSCNGAGVNYSVDNKRVQSYSKCANCTLLAAETKRADEAEKKLKDLLGATE